MNDDVSSLSCFQEGSQFCRGFGGIGGLLRWQVCTLETVMLVLLTEADLYICKKRHGGVITSNMVVCRWTLPSWMRQIMKMWIMMSGVMTLMDSERGYEQAGPYSLHSCPLESRILGDK